MSPKDGGSTAGFSTASQERVVETVPREALPPLPALTVLAHPDLERIGERVLLSELASGREALLSRLQPRFTAPGKRRGRALDDRYMSRRPRARLQGSPPAARAPTSQPGAGPGWPTEAEPSGLRRFADALPRNRCP